MSSICTAAVVHSVVQYAKVQLYANVFAIVAAAVVEAAPAVVLLLRWRRQAQCDCACSSNNRAVKPQRNSIGTRQAISCSTVYKSHGALTLLARMLSTPRERHNVVAKEQ
jgi:hypothetical protein